ncbi:NAD(P)H-quinone oxidoreductase [Corynebacterium pygosceleis]|uniref:NAD(P)H-quinone oxidoreductase n=1 Tax=Corynebacterium pygosceleis TaxID=2800406 RepID=A0A9Q4C9Z8_9CORY|nr:NAD(P)H-quinone oxidoreductase [Corynebacterium pygosceleis]MCK7637319.1 NAD(P)H-quinone oxidoreductase [Corynebacterium pygosceleis]MCK7675969.1 NAD(P)H-quinone oxidoreductase [Corynebacterium pygosceleis]MCL0119905.1 NAD(P)H-quinone oxidoreductase [Corynebacterium pygosceleis]MCX7445222.1 NAD(P)H-quinone oxidoreductase [Corynebacterium pygosceleis]MCX7468353.1 NAD(P)H-quinone oxidoreductase [Corynebacterium pygosceleis]
MKAITLENPDDRTSLTWTEVPTPEIRAGEVLVEVKAVGVNRADLLQAAGHYPPPPGVSEIIGLECAGVITDPGDTDRKKGEKVACLLAGGAYAEYVAVPVGQLLPVPEGYSFAEAASVVEVACTLWSNLVTVAGLREGQTVLLHGGAGGIGTFGIQLAKQLGCTVAVTAGSAEKLETCRELGADILVNYREEDFAEVLKNRADVILDIMGAKYLDPNLRALAMDGHIVIIGMQGGVKGELNIARLLSKRGSISATGLRGRDLEDKAGIVAEVVERVWPMLDDGRVRVNIHRTLPIEQAAEAHRLLDSGEVTGKLVLTLD